MMDNLAKDAFLARQNGMSYGNYMASKKPVIKPVVKPVRKAPEKPKYEVKRNCIMCGNEFVRYDKRPQKYCCNECYLVGIRKKLVTTTT